MAAVHRDPGQGAAAGQRLVDSLSLLVDPNLGRARSKHMTAYEWFNLTIGFLTLGVLSWTLFVLKAYARDTKTLARVAVEQLPRPCVVLKRSADSSDEAVLKETTVSLVDQRRLNLALLHGPEQIADLPDAGS